MNLNSSFTQVSGRLAKIIVALAVVGSALAGLRGGWPWASGFALGAAASYLNYRNLAHIVSALGEPRSTGRMGAFAWLLFRIILLVAGAFVTIRFTQVNVYAGFAGLLVPVAAVVPETILQLIYAR